MFQSIFLAQISAGHSHDAKNRFCNFKIDIPTLWSYIRVKIDNFIEMATKLLEGQLINHKCWELIKDDRMQLAYKKGPDLLQGRALFEQILIIDFLNTF